MTTPTRESVRAQVEQLVRAGDTKALKQIRDQLQRKHDRRSLKERARLYAHNPVGWVTERLKQIVWSKQREIMLSIAPATASASPTPPPSSPPGGSTPTRPAKHSSSPQRPPSPRSAPSSGGTSAAPTAAASSPAD